MVVVVGVGVVVAVGAAVVVVAVNCVGVGVGGGGVIPSPLAGAPRGFCVSSSWADFLFLGVRIESTHPHKHQRRHDTQQERWRLHRRPSALASARGLLLPDGSGGESSAW